MSTKPEGRLRPEFIQSMNAKRWPNAKRMFEAFKRQEPPIFRSVNLNKPLRGGEWVPWDVIVGLTVYLRGAPMSMRGDYRPDAIADKRDAALLKEEEPGVGDPEGVAYSMGWGKWFGMIREVFSIRPEAFCRPEDVPWAARLTMMHIGLLTHPLAGEAPWDELVEHGERVFKYSLADYTAMLAMLHEACPASIMFGVVERANEWQRVAVTAQFPLTPEAFAALCAGQKDVRAIGREDLRPYGDHIYNFAMSRLPGLTKAQVKKLSMNHVNSIIFQLAMLLGGGRGVMPRIAGPAIHRHINGYAEAYGMELLDMKVLNHDFGLVVLLPPKERASWRLMKRRERLTTWATYRLTRFIIRFYQKAHAAAKRRLEATGRLRVSTKHLSQPEERHGRE